jgi:hypothetical protein
MTAPFFHGSPSPLVREVRRHRPLAILVAGMTLALVVALAGLAVDPRMITGAPASLKPAKFAVSIAIYAATLAWLLGYLGDRPRLVAVLGWTLLLGFGIEMALIGLQAARGTTSHFNNATPFDAAVFRIMGLVIVGMWLLTAAVTVLLFRRRFAAPPIVWGVRLGLLIGLLGMAVAVLMTNPTPEQSASLARTGASAIIGAHTVGAADGGPGLPIVGWSTVGGDLRVAHFFGIHAMQALPLLGLALVRLAPKWLSMPARATLVGMGGAAWAALTLALTWQALRGQPVTGPDLASLLVFGAIAAAAVLAAAAVVWRAARCGRRPKRPASPAAHHPVAPAVESGRRGASIN